MEEKHRHEETNKQSREEKSKVKYWKRKEKLLE